MKKWAVRLLWILPAVAAFAVYYDSLSNEFIWDDSVVLKNQLTAFRSLGEVFLPPAGIPHFGTHYYRPLIIASFLLDRKFWGSSPFGFHFSVIIIHVINTVLIFFVAGLILKRFKKAKLGAFITSLLFAVHPIHTESVAWMAGRSDVLAALFFFISLILYLHYHEKRAGRMAEWQRSVSFILPSSIAFLLAALSKETALSLILILPVIDLCHRRDSDRKMGARKNSFGRIGGYQRWNMLLARYAPFLAALVVYLIFRYSALRHSAGGLLSLRERGETILNFINAYGFYIRKLLVPVNLAAYIPEVPSGTFFTLSSIFLLLILVLSGAFALARRNMVVLFSVSFFLLTILPSLMITIVRVTEAPIAERYLYIPSFSLCLFGGFVAQYIPEKLQGTMKSGRMSEVSILIVFLIISASFSIMTVMRNHVWKEDISFWEDITRKVQDYGLPHLNLGVAYREKDRLDEAEREYRKATDAKKNTDEGRAAAYNNLGNVLITRGDLAGAEENIRIALTVRPDYANAYYSMALLLWKRYRASPGEGRAPDEKLPIEAVGYLKKAIQLNQHYVIAHMLIGQIYLKLGKHDEARSHLQTVLMYEQEGVVALAAREMLKKIPEPGK